MAMLGRRWREGSDDDADAAADGGGGGYTHESKSKQSSTKKFFLCAQKNSTNCVRKSLCFFVFRNAFLSFTFPSSLK